MKAIFWFFIAVGCLCALANSQPTAEQLAQVDAIRQKLTGVEFGLRSMKPVHPNQPSHTSGTSKRGASYKREIFDTFHQNMNDVNTENCDYIVLGSGSAGSVVAGLLSNDPDNSVCLFERGQDESTRDPFVQVPGLNWVQAVVPDGSLGPIEDVPSLEPFLGNFFDRLFNPWALGGGPGVSGSIWSCFSPRVFNDLAILMGHFALNFTNAMIQFRQNENVAVGDSPDLRGHTGPIQVQFLNESDPNIAGVVALQSAEFGYGLARDYCNPNGPAGIYPLQRSLKREPQCGTITGPCTRQSAYVGFVEPYLNNRTNLRVYTQAQVNEILFSRINKPNKNPKADGIRFTLNGVGHKIAARKAVISSLGTYNDAKMMMVSGIGDASILSQFDIQVVRNLTGVGKEIQDVPNIPLVYYLPFLPDLPFGAPLTAPTTVIASFFASPYHGGKVDIEILWGILPAFLFPQLPPGSPGGVLVAFIIQLFDASNGIMTPRSTNYAERFNYQSNFNPDMMNATIWGIQKFRNGLANIGSVYPNSFEVSPGPTVLALNATYEEVRAYIKNNNKNTQFNWNHPFSSCHMGPDSDPTAVVDKYGRVKGIDGLFIASNAIANPNIIPDGHPSSWASYIGRYVAENILNDVV